MTNIYSALQCHEKYSELSLLITAKQRTTPIRSSHQRQRGMTLIVGLILLAMLMVITTIGFRNITLSERITGNSFDRNISFQSAENAGKEALEVIEGAGFPPANRSDDPPGYYRDHFTDGGSTRFWTQGAGAVTNRDDCAPAAPFSWGLPCSAEVNIKYVNHHQKAQYAIEFLSGDINAVSTYRVTSRSTGGSGNAEVVLQTIYIRAR